MHTVSSISLDKLLIVQLDEIKAFLLAIKVKDHVACRLTQPIFQNLNPLNEFV